MSFNFKQSAQERTTLSKIMVGREQLTTEDVNNQILTIIGFDFAPKFDKVIINDDLDIAKAEALAVIKEFIER